MGTKARVHCSDELIGCFILDFAAKDKAWRHGRQPIENILRLDRRFELVLKSGRRDGELGDGYIACKVWFLGLSADLSHVQGVGVTLLRRALCEQAVENGLWTFQIPGARTNTYTDGFNGASRN
ncbi:MAG: hypothetical protein AAF355_01570 [Myxococcota bacterium]